MPKSIEKLNADLSAEVQRTKAEIERLKKELKKRKKYGLVWEEKPEEVVEMCKEKLPVLKDVKQKVKLSPISEAILRVYRRIFK